MANTVTFQGGPCDGRSETFTNAELTDGIVACGGIKYAVLGESPGVYIAIPASTQVQALGTAGIAPNVTAGFNAVSRALATDLPTGMKRAAIVRAAAVAKIKRRSRIG